MRVLLQRVTGARVVIEGETVGAIGRGFVLLVGITGSDDEAVARHLAGKVANLRVFADEGGAMNRSALDLRGDGEPPRDGGDHRGEPVAMLVVSQFTLYADTRRGNRPSFQGAAPPDVAEPLYERVRDALGGVGGRFGAMMAVALVNDGPVTLLVEL
jgi:D-aminoacyl-tRNA deacylase